MNASKQLHSKQDKKFNTEHDNDKMDSKCKLLGIPTFLALLKSQTTSQNIKNQVFKIPEKIKNWLKDTDFFLS